MFGRRKPQKFGKLKYAYSRTPLSYGESRRRRKKLILHSLNPGVGKKIKIILIAITLLAGISYLAYFIFFSAYFNFKEIQVVQEGLEGKDTIFSPYFKEAKGKNLILVDVAKIQSKIIAEHPEFENLKIVKVYPSKIKVEASKYPVVANIINVVGDQQFKHIVNQVGISVQQNTENPNLKYIKIESEEPLETKSTLLPKEKLMYIIGAIDYFQDKFGMKVFEAEYLKAPREVHLKTEKYFFVWLDIERSYEEQLSKLKRVVPKLDIQNIPLQYIDLRISGGSGDKVIYKKR